jgi:hypothetical protein
MSWDPQGLAMRTRGARPSEKIALRVIPGFSPQGHLTSASPPAEGRAPHARKESMTPTLTSPRFGHGPFADPGVAMTRPGFGPARICGRTECVPPRKPPSASSRAFPRKAILPWIVHPSEGRAPHARWGGCLNRAIAPLGHLLFALLSVIMTCPGLRPALHLGRGDRVPPRKSPFALSPGSPRKAIRPWLAHPSEGRAPHARKEGIT